MWTGGGGGGGMCVKPDSFPDNKIIDLRLDTM